MKKLLLLLAICFTSLLGFSQNIASISKESLTAGNSNNQYVYQLPATITAKDVDQVKGYYKSSITVTFNEAKHLLTVELLKKEEMNYRVMGRLFVALNCRTIALDGVNMSFDELYEAYMK